MNFIEGLAKSSRKDVIMVMVDCFTKYAHVVDFDHPFTTLLVAKAFLDNIFGFHRPPSTILSNRGSIFLIQFWNKLLELSGTKLLHFSTYYP